MIAGKISHGSRTVKNCQMSLTRPVFCLAQEMDWALVISRYQWEGDLEQLQVARPTSSSFSAMSAIELCVQTSSADVSFATQILIVMLPFPVMIHHQDYFIFCMVSLLSFTFHRYCEGFCIPTGHTLCYLRIQRRGKRRKRDAPMPQPQNMTQENRDQLLDELRSPDRPEPDKRGLKKNASPIPSKGISNSSRFILNFRSLDHICGHVPDWQGQHENTLQIIQIAKSNLRVEVGRLQTAQTHPWVATGVRSQCGSWQLF